MIDIEALRQAGQMVSEAHAIAWALWAAFFLLIYSQKTYYLGFCVLLALADGASGLEYAPALFVPFELVLRGTAFFADVRQAAIGKRASMVQGGKAGL